jgi:hypothetical protein
MFSYKYIFMAVRKLKLIIFGLIAILALVLFGTLTKLPDNSRRISSQVVTGGETTSLGQTSKTQL